MGGDMYPWHASYWEQLTKRANAGKLPHAILIKGVKGLGKLELARQFTNWLLCKESSRPCGTCTACHQFHARSHPDFIEVTPLEEKKVISVDQVRELSSTLNQTASKGGWKVTIIHPADAMNINAANSLLKTLEEPSSASILFLVSSIPAQLPATILSRCMQVSITPPLQQQSVAWLNHSNEEEARIVLAHSGGAPLEAQRLLATDFLAIRKLLVRQLAEITRGKLNPIMAAETWLDHPVEALQWLNGWVEDLVRVKQIPELPELVINQDCMKDLQTAAERIHLISLHKYLKALGEGSRLLRTTANIQLLLESLLIPWAFDLNLTTIEQLA